MMPTKTKLKPKQVYVCWESFAGNEGLSVAEGTRLRGDHELVQRYPERFVEDGTPDDEVDRLRAAAFAPVLAGDSKPPLGRVRLRIRPREGNMKLEPAAYVGDKPYYEGDTLVLEGDRAEHLIDVGVAEIVKELD
jgi:hypothetical protein